MYREFQKKFRNKRPYLLLYLPVCLSAILLYAHVHVYVYEYVIRYDNCLVKQFTWDLLNTLLTLKKEKVREEPEENKKKEKEEKKKRRMRGALNVGW